jgi:hypothetical protein
MSHAGHREVVQTLGKYWNNALERRRRAKPKSGLAPPAQKKAAWAITVRLVSATAGGLAGFVALRGGAAALDDAATPRSRRN